MFFVASFLVCGVTFWMTFAVSGRAAAARAAVVQNAAKSEALQAMSREAVTTKDARALLEGFALPQDGNAAFISDIERMAKSAGVDASVESVSAVPPKGNSPGTLALDVRFSGPYARCVQFVSLIETLPVATRIRTLTLQHDESAWNGTVSFSSLSFDTP